MELKETSFCKQPMREIYEETGISIWSQPLLNVYTNFDESYPNGDKVQTDLSSCIGIAGVGSVDISNFHNGKLYV